MTNLLADLRYALRTLGRSPLFAAVAILSLALGIGANTAIFTLMDQIVWRHAAALGVASGHFAQYDARHVDAEDRHHRANDQRIFGRQLTAAIHRQGF
jgi:hypothetical protein